MWGARVFEYLIMFQQPPSHFENIKKFIEKDFRGDIRNASRIKELVKEVQPDYVFHLAAQSLVKKSYSDPILTWETNLMGNNKLIRRSIRIKKKMHSYSNN